jgi:hypothetical protein
MNILGDAFCQRVAHHSQGQVAGCPRGTLWCDVAWDLLLGRRWAKARLATTGSHSLKFFCHVHNCSGTKLRAGLLCCTLQTVHTVDRHAASRQHEHRGDERRNLGLIAGSAKQFSPASHDVHQAISDQGQYKHIRQARLCSFSKAFRCMQVPRSVSIGRHQLSMFCTVA